MKSRRFFAATPLLAFLALAVTLISAASGASAQEQAWIEEFGDPTALVVPQSRSYSLREHQPAIILTGVDARIVLRGQAAATTLEIMMENRSDSMEEAVLLLPVPEGAVVSNFMFEGAASEPTAEVLPREEARRIYRSIVNQVRDPALLEFAGYRLIRTSVFPVEAHGSQRVRLTYDQILPRAGSRIDYLLPRSESLAATCPWTIRVVVDATSPISTVYSPSHEVTITRQGEQKLDLTLRDDLEGRRPGPFRLSILLEDESGVSASLFAYPDPKVGGGYFLLIAGLPVSIDDAQQTLLREVTIVLDRSGSMAGEKMDQAKAAALQVIEGLNDGEAFNIIDYATDVSAFSTAPVIKNSKNAAAARVYLDMIKPRGGTNIHDALVEALRQPPTEGMLPIVLFLTDGLPTIGQTSETAIREMVAAGNAHHRRIFTFGVGADVNAPLLDRVAEMSRAVSSYVLPGEDVEVEVAHVFRRLYGLVLAGVDLDVLDASGNIDPQRVRELMPSPIPDLFDGDDLILLGQYRNDDPLRFRLDGNFLGEAKTFAFNFDLDSATTRNSFVPRLWAARRIAYLVDQIRQAGAEQAAHPTVADWSPFDDPRFKEVAEEILRLSTEFGILTEYTSFLAREGTTMEDWDDLLIACGERLDAGAVRDRWGLAAVGRSMSNTAGKGAQVMDNNIYLGEQLRVVTERSENYALEGGGLEGGMVVAQPESEQLAFRSQLQYMDFGIDANGLPNVQQISDRAFYKQGQCWIDGNILVEKQQVELPAPDEVIEFGSDRHFELVEALVADGRQALVSLPGDVMVRYEGKLILIHNATHTP